MQHTPGPWETMTEELHFEILANDRAITVAKVYREKDVKLIAAAPDLLEACKAAFDTIPYANDCVTARIITDAIAKAEGK